MIEKGTGNNSKAIGKSELGINKSKREGEIFMRIESFRDLIVWQRSMELVVLVYEKIIIFPRNEEYGLTSQIKRAAVSIPSNIAEGYGRNSTGDYVRFLQISLGSLYELQTQLEISRRLSFLKDSDCQELNGICKEVSKMIVSLINKLSVA